MAMPTQQAIVLLAGTVPMDLILHSRQCMEANVLQDSSVHQDPTKCKTVPQENTVLRMVWLNLLPIVILVTIVPQVQHNLNKLIVLSAIIVQQEVTSRSHVLMELTDQ